MTLSKYFNKYHSYLLDTLTYKFLFTGIYSSYEICYTWIASMDNTISASEYTLYIR